MQTYTIQSEGYSEESSQGIKAVLCDLGATLLEVHVPDGSGDHVDVITGPPTVEELQKDQCFMGSSAGRFANRIKEGKFSLNGDDYQLTINDGVNHLHGGTGGIHKLVWSVVEQAASKVVFECECEDGSDGYPGNLKIRASYEITAENVLEILYTAETDAATPVNVVQHAYWNLSGDPKQDIRSHVIEGESLSHFLMVGEGAIPVGEVAPVDGTAFDFRLARTVQSSLDQGHRLFDLAGGIDHCFVLEEALQGQLVPVVTLSDPASGRSLKISSNMPAVQIYTGNFLDGSQPSREDGVMIGKQTGICLETQHFPDAVNHAHFPSCILNPGEEYNHKMVLEFLAGQ